MQGDMITVELATKKHGSTGKIENRSTVRSQGKSGCNVQHTLKEWRGRNPYLKTGKSKAGVMLMFLQAGRRRQHPNTYVSISAIRPVTKYACLLSL